MNMKDGIGHSTTPAQVGGLIDTIHDVLCA